MSLDTTESRSIFFTYLPCFCPQSGVYTHWKDFLPFWTPAKPSLLQAELSQLSVSPRIRCFRPFCDLNGPSLDLVQQAHASLVRGSPVLDTALQARPHQRWAENNSQLIQPVGNSFSNAAQEYVSCLCCKGTLLTQVVSAHFVCNWCSVWTMNIRKTVSFSR